MGMKEGYDIVQDTTAAEDAAKAKRRMALCVQDPAEQMLTAYEPNAARGNVNPGYPSDEYGEMDKD